MTRTLALLLVGCSTTSPQLPPPGSLTLEVGALVPGQTAVYTVTGATPGAPVYVGLSTTAGNGPCPPLLAGTCLGIEPPITLVGQGTADASGAATLTAVVPDAPVDVCLQAAESGPTPAVSTPVCVTVGPPQVAGNTVGLQAFSDLAEPGYTLFSPLTGTTTHLVDLLGREVHRWDHPDVPGSATYFTDAGTLLHASIATTSATPALAAGGNGGRIQELDWDGSVIWELVLSDDDRRLHHDLAPLPNGNVLAVAWEYLSPATAQALGRDPALTPLEGLWPDVILELQPNAAGSADVVWEWKASDHLVQDLDATLPDFDDPADRPERIDVNYELGALRGDWMHANAIDYSAEWDQILLSVPYFDEIWVLDHSTTTAEAATSSGGRYGRGGDLLWRWGNPEAYGRGTSLDKQLNGQHDAEWIRPGLRGAGDILVFDNGTAATGTAILQLTPPRLPDGSFEDTPGPLLPLAPTEALEASPPQAFFASFVSGAQRLPNGSTLVTDGPTGNFLEVTQNNRLAWRYQNPIANGVALSQGDTPQPAGRGLATRIFRAERLPPTHPGLQGRDLTPGDVLEQ